MGWVGPRDGLDVWKQAVETNINRHIIKTKSKKERKKERKK
jgi:hypothetical protein